jgi:HK97 family phage major capsid protein
MDLSEIKNVLDAQGRAWEEFKTANDALLKAKAEGKAVGDLEAKVAKIGSDLDKIASLKTEFDAAIAEMKRPRAGDTATADFEIETKQFNLFRTAHANRGVAVAPVDGDTYAAYKRAFWTLCRTGNVELLDAPERKALQAGVDSDGGYLLPAPTVGRIVKKVYELSPLRQIVNVQAISTDALEGLNDLDEASCGWVGEIGTRSDTNTPTVGKYRLEAHEMYAQPKATQKILDDAAIDIEGWLADKVADKFARTEGAAFITGNGVTQPRGITTYTTAATADASRSWGQFEHVVTGANGGFAASTPADVLFDLIGKFKQAYLQAAKFLTRREVITLIRKFKEATTNAYMWQPGLQAGQPDRLLGYPITIAQDMPAVATGSLSLAFGDFMEAYTIVDRMGARTLRDPYTDKPYVKFYTTRRVGGGAINYEAVKFLKFST